MDKNIKEYGEKYTLENIGGETGLYQPTEYFDEINKKRNAFLNNLKKKINQKRFLQLSRSRFFLWRQIDEINTFKAFYTIQRICYGKKRSKFFHRTRLETRCNTVYASEN